ncbi:MAG TPA: peptidase T [Vicinamibacterales bacterium]|nr:peptidase T [Vicinamibacterales bacterium]
MTSIDLLPLKADALARFLRYVVIDTRSDEKSTSVPSTPGQLTLLRLLADELRALGLADVSMDEFGYVMATVPATSPKADVPAVGFIAHVDTSPEMSATDVRPIVHRAYDGRDLVLPDDPGAVIRPADVPELRDQLGHDIVTASGLTLLGADDKAGAAAIMAAAAYLTAHPDIPHGPMRIGFTPDEEVGRGTAHFDVARFGAYCAYTLDGGERGDIESESFSADVMTVTFHGFNTHPGYAKGKMVNAIRMAADFIHRLPQDRLSPETTDGYEGYLHPYVVQASTERTSVRLLVRDFVTGGLHEKEALVDRLARETVAAFPGGRVEIAIEEQYRNMREILDGHPEIVASAAEAIRRVGLEPRTRPIRGGTDGSRLSFMGLPTPNLFAGQHNIHSRLEWVSPEDMARAAAAVIEICRIWEERPRPALRG